MAGYCAYCRNVDQVGGCSFCGATESDTVVRLVPRANMPNDKLVAMLERLLDDAKKGELKHVSVACIWDNDTTSWGCTAGVSYAMMLGAITRLQLAYFQLNE